MANPDRTTEALLARRALAEKATPGPWVKGITIGRGYAVDAIWDCSGALVADTEKSVSPYEESDAAHIAASDPATVMADIDEILRLRAGVERLEKEANWLAIRLANALIDPILIDDLHALSDGLPHPPTPEMLRETARKAVGKVK